MQLDYGRIGTIFILIRWLWKIFYIEILIRRGVITPFDRHQGMHTKECLRVPCVLYILLFRRYDNTDIPLNKKRRTREGGWKLEQEIGRGREGRGQRENQKRVEDRQGIWDKKKDVKQKKIQINRGRIQIEEAMERDRMRRRGYVRV